MLTWTRKTISLSAGDVEVERIPSAVWRLRGQAHYITYDESAESAGGGTRTTLKMERDALTWVRHGLVTWTHVFREGERHVSRMMVAGRQMDIETHTSSLLIDVREHSGEVALVYAMGMVGDTEQVALTFQFKIIPSN